MANPFDDMLAVMDGWITDSFGHQVTVTPQIKNDYVGFVPDPGRAAQTVPGVFTIAPFDGRSIPGENSSLNRIVAQAAAVWLPASSLAALGYEPRAGDMIQIAGRSEKWRVVSPRAAGRTGAEYTLSPAAEAPE